MTEHNTVNCWVITEGMIGTQNQCLGVAQALGVTPRVLQVGLRQPWKSLSPWLGCEQRWSFIPDITPPQGEDWPDLLICAGRKAVAAARYIKKQSAGKSFTVFLQDPKINTLAIDLIALPHHDTRRGDNIVVTHGAPNLITPENLARAKQDFAPLFSSIRAPKVAVMIGGNSKTHTITPDIIKQLLTQLNDVNASLMVTASRRTGEENTSMIRNHLDKTGHYFWDGTGANPYIGMLAWADHIVVTSDSVSMLSDAATTGKPVHMVPLNGKSPRFSRLYQHFEDIGAMRIFDGTLPKWHYPPINDANMIADEIKRRSGLPVTSSS